VIEHGECRTDFVEHDRVVFVVNVGLHGAEERVTQYSVRGGTFGKSDRDRCVSFGRPWAVVKIRNWDTVEFCAWTEETHKIPTRKNCDVDVL
jgi:hypothetical protein